jgi:hypothetical protein
MYVQLKMECLNFKITQKHLTEKTIISRTDEADVLELTSHAELKMLALAEARRWWGTDLTECRNGAGQAVTLQNPGNAPGHGHRSQWGGGSTLKVNKV